MSFRRPDPRQMSSAEWRSLSDEERQNILARDAMRWWLRSRIMLVLIFVPGLVVMVVAQACLGAWEGLCNFLSEFRSGWRVLGGGRR